MNRKTGLLYLSLVVAFGLLTTCLVDCTEAHSIPGKNMAHQVKNKIYKKKEAHKKAGKAGLLHHHQ